MHFLDQKAHILILFQRWLVIPSFLAIVFASNFLNTTVFLMKTEKILASIFIMLISTGILIFGGHKMYQACPKIEVNIRLA